MIKALRYFFLNILKMIHITSKCVQNSITFLMRKYNFINYDQITCQFLEKQFNFKFVNDWTGDIEFNNPEDESVFILRFS